MEFRGFVRKGELRALSQYNHSFVSDKLVKNKEYIYEIIVTFFKERVQPALCDHFQDYIVDFALTGSKWKDAQCCESEEEERVWVIELNPYLESSDAALYSWKTDRDLLVGLEEEESAGCQTSHCEDAKKPVECVTDFRIRDKFSKAVLANIKSEWRAYLE